MHLLINILEWIKDIYIVCIISDDKDVKLEEIKNSHKKKFAEFEIVLQV